MYEAKLIVGRDAVSAYHENGIEAVDSKNIIVSKFETIDERDAYIEGAFDAVGWQEIAVEEEEMQID